MINYILYSRERIQYLNQLQLHTKIQHMLEKNKENLQLLEIVIKFYWQVLLHVVKKYTKLYC